MSNNLTSEEIQKIESYLPSLQAIYDGLIKLGAKSVKVSDMYAFIKSGGSMGEISELIDPSVITSIRNFLLGIDIDYVDHAVKIADRIGKIARIVPNGINPNHYEIKDEVVQVRPLYRQ